MNTLIHADIFFFISTICFILVTIALIIVLVYVIKILRDVSELTRKVKEESIEIIDDVRALREDIETKGFGISRLVKFFGKLYLKRRRSARKRQREELEES